MIIINYYSQIQTGSFHTLNGPIQPTAWFHLGLVYHGSEDGQGFTVYYDGRLLQSVTQKIPNTFDRGRGKLVVGRILIDKDNRYASIEVDDIILWNRQLNVQEILYFAQIP